jgi:hypothetical protein
MTKKIDVTKNLYRCKGVLWYDSFLDQKRRSTTATAKVRATSEKEARKKFEKWLADYPLENSFYDPREVLIEEEK